MDAVEVSLPPPVVTAPSPAHSATSGTLKATINLSHSRRQASVRDYFYLLRDGAIDNSASGAADWLALANLRGIFDKYRTNPPAEELSMSDYVRDIAGCLDTPASEDHGSLLMLLDKPPVVREIVPLTPSNLNAFRMLPGPIPPQYKHLVHVPPKRGSKVTESRSNSRLGAPPNSGGTSSYLLPPPPANAFVEESKLNNNDFAPSSQESLTDFMSPGTMDDDIDYQIPAEKKRRKTTEKRRKAK